MPFGYDDTFVVKSPASDPWQLPSVPHEVAKPDFADDEALKQSFGIELGKGLDPFKAGLAIFKNEMPKALWASINWINDPVVMASKDAYTKTLKSLQKPLDKEELLAKILEFTDETDIYGRRLVEAKERLNALNLYAEILGYKGKIDINASTNNTTNNFTKITKVVLVKPDSSTTIDATSNIQSKIQNEHTSSIPLKLVGGVDR